MYCRTPFLKVKQCVWDIFNSKSLHGDILLGLTETSFLEYVLQSTQKVVLDRGNVLMWFNNECVKVWIFIAAKFPGYLISLGT